MRALVIAVVAAELAVLAFWPRDGVIQPLPVAASQEFSAREIDRARDYRGPQLALLGGALVVQAGLLTLLMVRERGRRRPRVRRPVLAAGRAGAGVWLALILVTLPIDAIRRQRAIDVGLVTRSWEGWIWDVARSAAVAAVIAGLATAVAVALMRRLPRGWWVPASGLLGAAAAAFVFAGPLVIDPLFNRFEDLPQGRTRSAVIELSQRAGVKVGDVLVIDASKRTTGANAYVTGLGSSKRVVLYDTLLRDFDHAQVRLVVAHELGHVRSDDVVRGLLFVFLIAPAGIFAVSRLTRAWGPQEDERGPDPGPATVPALIAAFAVVALILGSISGQLSRRVEARADSFSLSLTRDPGTFIAQQRRLAIRNVSDPDPPWIVRALLATHPTTVHRIGIGRAWEAGRRP